MEKAVTHMPVKHSGCTSAFVRAAVFPTDLFETLLVSLYKLKKKQTTGNCSAGVLFDRSGERRSAQVQASCEELLKVDTLPQEEAFYQQCETNGSMSAQNLPGELNRSHMSCCSKAHIVKPLTTLYEVRDTLMTF